MFLYCRFWEMGAVDSEGSIAKGGLHLFQFFRNRNIFSIHRQMNALFTSPIPPSPLKWSPLPVNFLAWRIASTMFLLMAGVGSIYIVIIVFIQEALRSSTAYLGLLVMFLGIGLFLGSIAYGKFGSGFPKRKVINFGLMTTGLIVVIFTICLKFAPSFLIAGVLSVALGIFSAPIIVSSNTLLHEVMLDEMRGRIFSSLEIIMHAGFLLFMFLASVTAEKIGRDWVLITIGALFSIIGLIKLARLEKEEKKG